MGVCIWLAVHPSARWLRARVCVGCGGPKCGGRVHAHIAATRAAEPSTPDAPRLQQRLALVKQLLRRHVQPNRLGRRLPRAQRALADGGALRLGRQILGRAGWAKRGV